MDTFRPYHDNTYGPSRPTVYAQAGKMVYDHLPPLPAVDAFQGGTAPIIAVDGFDETADPDDFGIVRVDLGTGSAWYHSVYVICRLTSHSEPPMEDVIAAAADYAAEYAKGIITSSEEYADLAREAFPQEVGESADGYDARLNALHCDGEIDAALDLFYTDAGYLDRGFGLHVLRPDSPEFGAAFRAWREFHNHDPFAKEADDPTEGHDVGDVCADCLLASVNGEPHPTGALVPHLIGLYDTETGHGYDSFALAPCDVCGAKPGARYRVLIPCEGDGQ